MNMNTSKTRGRPTIRLVDITSKNLKAVLSLKVSKDQERVYPRSNAYSIAEAHYPPDEDAVWMRAVYVDDNAVGFIMTSEVPEKGEYFLWRLMVDEKYQGNGYGAAAVLALVDRIKLNGNARSLHTDHLPGDNAAGGFYGSLGFRYTGEKMEGGELVMLMEFGREDDV